jgi:hypothetical protein
MAGWKVIIEPFDDLRTQTSTDNTDLLSKSRADVHMSHHSSIVLQLILEISPLGLDAQVSKLLTIVPDT